MRKVGVVGTGSFLPGDPIGNEVVESLFGSDDHFLSSMLGVTHRYWSSDPNTFELRYHNSDLAANAARVAMDAAGLQPSDVQLLIVNTCTPDYLMPPMAPLVQEKLEIRECAVVELRSGCVGSIAALAIGAQFVAAGAHANALVVASELSSSYNLLPVREKRDLRLEERLNGIMFGDGAGALVLAPSEHGANELECTCMNSIGYGRPPGMMLAVGGSSEPFSRTVAESGAVSMQHDRRAIERWGREMSLRALHDLCAKAGVSPDDIDCFIFPQANPAMLKHDTSSMPAERLAMNVDKIGNVISAGLMIAFDEVIRAHRVPSGGRIAMIGGEASKWLYGAALARV